MALSLAQKNLSFGCVRMRMLTECLLSNNCRLLNIIGIEGMLSVCMLA